MTTIVGGEAGRVARAVNHPTDPELDAWIAEHRDTDCESSEWVAWITGVYGLIRHHRDRADKAETVVEDLKVERDALKAEVARLRGSGYR